MRGRSESSAPFRVFGVVRTFGHSCDNGTGIVLGAQRRMLSRLAAVLLLLTVAGIALAYTTGIGYSIPLETAVKADITAASSPNLVNQKILDALERDDIADADLYFEIAKFMNYRLPPETQAKLDEAHTLSATVVRNTWEFGEGFATGDLAVATCVVGRSETNSAA